METHNWKQRSAALAGSVVAVLAAALLLLGGVQIRRLSSLDNRALELASEVRSLRADHRASPPAASDTSIVGQRIQELTSEVRTLRTELLSASLAGRSDASTRPSDEEQLSKGEDVELHAAAEARALVEQLSHQRTAEGIAAVLARIDSWVILPDQDNEVQALKAKLATELRTLVKGEVLELQRAALSAVTGAEGAKLHARAGAVLSLYPMSDEGPILEEAKSLSAQQGTLAARLEVLRRQRYNHWAAKQVEVAIDGYNKKSSYWSPKKENPLLIDSLVESLGEVDPALIEPAVLELYNYVIDLTKGSISEKDKIALAKRLTDPAIQRKTLGDF